jgi:hypothetical protein
MKNFTECEIRAPSRANQLLARDARRTDRRFNGATLPPNYYAAFAWRIACHTRSGVAGMSMC